MQHESVMPDELIGGVSIKPGNRILDATVGDGGYLAQICDQFGSAVTLYGLDADQDAVARTKDRFTNTVCTPHLHVGNFRHLNEHCQVLGVTTLERILFDLGLSSYQIDQSGRGFSFRREEPLAMTFQRFGAALTAYDVVNGWDEHALATVIRGYGDERFAKRIAHAIVRHRQAAAIETTSDLVNVIYDATPKRYHHQRLHPATRTFQAIRMAVNDEVTALAEGLTSSFQVLAPQGRIAVISFHSIEDRIVKHTFRQWRDAGEATLITKKPRRPTDEERDANPRARSARLRIIEKL